MVRLECLQALRRHLALPLGCKRVEALSVHLMVLACRCEAFLLASEAVYFLPALVALIEQFLIVEEELLGCSHHDRSLLACQTVVRCARQQETSLALGTARR